MSMPDLMTHILVPYAIGRLTMKNRQRLALLCLGAVFLFPREMRTSCLGWLLAGSGFHFLLDLLQKTVLAGNYYWFFPFSFERFQFGLFWPDESVFAIPLLLILALGAESIHRRRQGRSG